MQIPVKYGESTVVWQHEKYPNKAVTEQKFQFPDGRIEPFYIWGKNGTPAVITLPITTEKKVVVTRQWRPGPGAVIYEFAGGNKETDRSFEEAVAEELEQEVGYRASRVIKLPPFWIDAPSNRVPVIGCLATDCIKVGEPRPEKCEVLEPVEMSLEEWFALPHRPGADYNDGKSLAATFLVLPYLRALGYIDFAVRG